MRRIAKVDRSKNVTITRNRTKENSRVLSVLILVSVLFILPMSGLAGMERYVLDYNDRYFENRRGGETTLMLKRTLKQQYPWVNTRDLKLKNVTLVAKSKVGRGHVQLRVGRRASDFYRISGHPKSFRRDYRKSYDRIRLSNPSRDSRGPWQMNLNGNFNVRKIIIITEDHHHTKRDYYSWR